MEIVIDIPKEDWKFLKESDGCRWSRAIIEGVANGKPLPKGHWTERTMHSNGFFLPNCSECGRMQPYAHHIYQPNFCPNCGADMRGEQK